jgi:HlyD family secretion protein
LQRRRHMLSRYVAPGALLCGFVLLIAWASRDVLFPAHDVWVVPVLAAQTAARSEGTPLFQAAGWIEPRPTPIRVAALAPGVIEDLLVVQDESVKAGQPIAELVKEDARLAYDLTAATQRIREAELEDAEAAVTAATTRLEQPVHLEAMLGDAAAALASVTTEQTNLPYEIRRAEAQLTFARQDYEGKLAAAEAVSERSIQAAKSVFDAAQATLSEFEDRAGSLANQAEALGRRRDALAAQLELLIDEKQAKSQAVALVNAARAKVAQGKVALAQAQLRLERMTVRAPVEGRIYQLVAFPGTTLTAGMGAIQTGDSSTVVTMYQPEMLQVRVDARFEDIPKVSLGQRVEINNPALPRPLQGAVLFVSSEANIQKNTLQVKVAIDNPPPVFKPEMLVDVTFLAPKPPTAERDEVIGLFVPPQVVERGEDGTFLWLADQSEGVARKIPVVVGAVGSGDLVEVRGEGLTVGSRIIARGSEGLENGAKIRVVSEEPARMRVALEDQASRQLTELP